MLRRLFGSKKKKIIENEKKKYGIFAGWTDAGEALVNQGRWEPMVVLSTGDRVTGGLYYKGGMLYLQREKVIRKMIEESSITECDSIYTLIGVGGGGACPALLQTKLLLEHLPSHTQVNIVAIISEFSHTSVRFNTAHFLHDVKSLLKSKNISLTLICNQTLMSILGTTSYDDVNDRIIQAIKTEAIGSTISRYDAEDAFSKDEFKISTISLEESQLSSSLSENVAKIETMVENALKNIWIDENLLGINLDFSGVWLLLALPKELYQRLQETGDNDIETMARDAIAERFGGLKSGGILPEIDSDDKTSLLESHVHVFPADSDVIRVFGRFALNKDSIMPLFDKASEFCQRVWNYPEELGPYVRLAKDQAKFKERFERRVRRWFYGGDSRADS